MFWRATGLGGMRLAAVSLYDFSASDRPDEPLNSMVDATFGDLKFGQYRKRNAGRSLGHDSSSVSEIGADDG